MDNQVFNPNSDDERVNFWYNLLKGSEIVDVLIDERKSVYYSGGVKHTHPGVVGFVIKKRSGCGVLSSIRNFLKPKIDEEPFTNVEIPVYIENGSFGEKHGALVIHCDENGKFIKEPTKDK